MAARDAHLEQARSNRRLAEDLYQRALETHDNVYAQWAVTCAFYCSVHCIEAKLADLGLHSQHHGDRDTKIGRNCPNNVYAAHNMLRDFSQEARYLLGRFSRGRVRSVVLEKYLAQVTRYVHLDDTST